MDDSNTVNILWEIGVQIKTADNKVLLKAKSGAEQLLLEISARFNSIISIELLH